MNHKKRSRLLSNKFQRDFIIKFCVIVVLGALISGAIIYAMSKATVTTTFEGSRLKIKSTADFILPAVMLSSAVIIVFMGLSAMAIALFSYRKIEKPLFKIEEEIEKADAGNLNIKLPVHEDEEFKALTRSLNKLIKDFRGVIVAVKSDVLELEADFEELERKKSLKIPKKIKDILMLLKEEVFHLST